MSDMTIDLSADGRSSQQIGLTGASLLFLTIGSIAAIIRVTDLGHLPLSPDEAAQAWAVWGFGKPGVDVLLTGSPAYFSMSKLLSQLFGDSDAIMRLGPALLGIGIVLLPWLWQKRLGMIGALTSSILLAASPLQTIIARTASGDSTAVFALLLLLIAIFRYRETIDKRWLYAIAAAIGLGVATTPLFYGGLVSMSMAFGIHR
ncbi:MAG: phospholipid carrier-dependent glycosyltransferase, partial [Chloroflexi bacterium]|nr:phospholipid carrier-dependent glycosyltransferase [Chloroflexota bacterium]